MKKILLAGIMLILVASVTTYVYHATQQADIYYYKGHHLFVKGSYKGAVPFFLESLSHDPKRVKTLSELGYAYLWSGNHLEAIKVFQELISLEPGSLRARKSLASAYSWNKDYAKAEALFLEAIRADPKDRIAQKELAEIYIWDKKFDKAKNVLTTLLENDPGDARAKFLYGKALLYSGQTREAIKIFEDLSKGTQEDTGESA